MPEKNVGLIDRVLRVILGIAMLAGFFLGLGDVYKWLFLAGVIPLATGVMSVCPFYALFGMSTCPIDKE